jgi:hypothetical protein
MGGKADKFSKLAGRGSPQPSTQTYNRNDVKLDLYLSSFLKLHNQLIEIADAYCSITLSFRLYLGHLIEMCQSLISIPRRKRIPIFGIISQNYLQFPPTYWKSIKQTFAPFDIV